MKTLSCAIFLMLLSANIAAASDESLLARVTVYWRGEHQTRAATGPRLRANHCAVDPKRIPYGSRVVMADGEFVAVDTGPAVVRRTAARRDGRTVAQREAIVVDRFFESKSEATKWVAAHPPFMPVRIIRPGSDWSGKPIATSRAPTSPGEGPSADGASVARISANQVTPAASDAIGNARDGHAGRRRDSARALVPPLDD